MPPAYGASIWIHDLEFGTFGTLTSGRDFYPVWKGRSDATGLVFSRQTDRDVHVYSAVSDRSREPVPLLTRRGQYRTQDVSPDALGCRPSGPDISCKPSAKGRLTLMEDGEVIRAMEWWRWARLTAGLVECPERVNAIQGRTLDEVFGPVAMKFRSSMTLFSAITDDGSPFRSALRKHCADRPDERTLELLVGR